MESWDGKVVNTEKVEKASRDFSLVLGQIEAVMGGAKSLDIDSYYVDIAYMTGKTLVESLELVKTKGTNIDDSGFIDRLRKNVKQGLHDLAEKTSEFSEVDFNNELCPLKTIDALSDYITKDVAVTLNCEDNSEIKIQVYDRNNVEVECSSLGKVLKLVHRASSPVQFCTTSINLARIEVVKDDITFILVVKGEVARKSAEDSSTTAIKYILIDNKNKTVHEGSKDYWNIRNTLIPVLNRVLN